MNLDNKYKMFGNGNQDVKSLGWGSESAQTVRFDELCKIGIKSGDSLLDVGCGYGDIIRHLNSKNILLRQYLGTDLRMSAINEARRRHPYCQFIRMPLQDVESKFDWVVASGIFCFKEFFWRKKTISSLQKMLSIANKGVGVNFLSTLGDSKNPDMKYVGLIEAACIIKKLGVKRFSISHTYRDNDMTVLLLK